MRCLYQIEHLSFRKHIVCTLFLYAMEGKIRFVSSSNTGISLLFYRTNHRQIQCIKDFNKAETMCNVLHQHYNCCLMLLLFSTLIFNIEFATTCLRLQSSIVQDLFSHSIQKNRKLFLKSWSYYIQYVYKVINYNSYNQDTIAFAKLEVLVLPRIK